MDSISYVHSEFGPQSSALHKSACQYMDQYAETHPDKNAFVIRPSTDKRDSITFKELALATRRLAHWFSTKLGLKHGERVAFLADNSLTYILCDLALGRLGVVSVRLFPGSKIKHVLDKTAPCNVVLTQPKYLSLFEELKSKLVIMDGIVLEEDHPKHVEVLHVPNYKEIYMNDQDLKKVEEHEKQVQFEDEAVIFSTSGISGEPKLVVHTHQSRINYGTQVMKLCGLTSDDVYFIDRPFAHIGGNVTQVLAFGTTLVVLNPHLSALKAHIQYVFDVLRDEKVTCGFTLPYILHDMVKSGAVFSSLNLKFLLFAGQIMSAEVLHAVKTKVTAPLVNSFGTTEIGDVCSTSPEEEVDVAAETIGTALPGVELKVVHPETNEILPREQVGLMAVRKPYKWYYLHGSPAEEFDSGGYFYTGDLIKMRTDGRVQVMGRRDDVINVGAVKFYPIEIENVIYQLESVDKVVVFGVPDDRLGNVVGVAILPKIGQVIERQDVTELFSGAEEPRYVWTEAAFPVTASGKVDRNKVKQRCLRNLDSYKQFANMKLSDVFK